MRNAHPTIPMFDLCWRGCHHRHPEPPAPFFLPPSFFLHPSYFLPRISICPLRPAKALLLFLAGEAAGALGLCMLQYKLAILDGSPQPSLFFEWTICSPN